MSGKFAVNRNWGGGGREGLVLHSRVQASFTLLHLHMKLEQKLICLRFKLAPFYYENNFFEKANKMNKFENDAYFDNDPFSV